MKGKSQVPGSASVGRLHRAIKRRIVAVYRANAMGVGD
jgi:hypothetical protein